MGEIKVETPYFSVITVVKNGASTIDRTISSVLSQTFSNFEYIILDGQSTDGTLDILNKYENEIDIVISEKDSGIYDAMNKGLTKATGNWVNFMNAGDTFYTPEIISDIFGSQIHPATVIYGGVEIIYPDLSRIEYPGSPSKLWKGMQFSHQATFINTHYHRMHFYNTANKIAADLEFFYQAYQTKNIFFPTGRIIAKVITGGVSDVNRIKTIMASCDAVCGDRLRPLIRFYFLWRIISSTLRTVVKRSLPRSIVRKLILLK